MYSNKKKCVVVILTFNSQKIIKKTICQAKKITKNIIIVDSGSIDETLEIARNESCDIYDHPFVNYSIQRNWAIEIASKEFIWQLHLDADEVLDEELINNIKNVINKDHKTKKKSYLIKRRDYFMGRELKFSGVNPWHLRLFLSGYAKCENRTYDQHFISNLSTEKLRGYVHDYNTQTLYDWIASHNRWSSLEATQVSTRGKVEGQLEPKLFGDSRERTRFFKNCYYSLPSLLRVIIFFNFRYFIRLGFLDGLVGFYYAFFQALWFRMLVDAKFNEMKSLEECDKQKSDA